MLAWLQRHRSSLRRRNVPIWLALLLLASSIILLRHSLAKDHYLSPEYLDPTSRPPTVLSPKEAKTTCRAHNFAPFPRPDRKVYDILTINTELDMLEIRLHTLAPYVDYFIIVEADTTFSGKPKSLYFNSTRARFAAFDSQIIHRIVHIPRAKTGAWGREDWQRTAGLTEVFPSLAGTPAEPRIGDALLVSDLDEIVRPGVLLLLRYCDFPSRLILRLRLYYYSFQWLHVGPLWTHPDATVYKGMTGQTLTPTELRAGLLGPGFAPVASFRRWWNRATIWDAGWHCSSCMRTVKDLRTKISSYSHTGHNTARNKDLKTMIERVRRGKDLFGRKDQIYERVEGNEDVPLYVLEQYRHTGRFKYILDRDGPDAGFEDLP